MKPRDEAVNYVLGRGHAIFLEAGDKVNMRRKALMAAMGATLKAGLLPDAEACCEIICLD